MQADEAKSMQLCAGANIASQHCWQNPTAQDPHHRTMNDKVRHKKQYGAGKHMCLEPCLCLFRARPTKPLANHVEERNGHRFNSTSSQTPWAPNSGRKTLDSHSKLAMVELRVFLMALAHKVHCCSCLAKILPSTPQHSLTSVLHLQSTKTQHGRSDRPQNTAGPAVLTTQTHAPVYTPHKSPSAILWKEWQHSFMCAQAKDKPKGCKEHTLEPFRTQLSFKTGPAS
jgi:hypothetical protein